MILSLQFKRFFLLVLLLSTFSGIGQKSEGGSSLGVLLLKHGEKELKVEEGTVVKLWLYSQRKPISGKLYLKDKSFIHVGDKSIFLSDVEMIRFKNKTSYISGSGLAFVSLVVVVAIIYFVSIVATMTNHIKLGFLASSPLIFSGLYSTILSAKILSIGLKYSTKQWQLSIVPFND